MAFCSKCGAQLADNAAFCPGCGQSQGSAPAGARNQAGLDENVAATLSHALGWVTGLVFYLIDQRPFVRFHAAQSLVTFGGLHLIRMMLGIAFGISLISGGMLGWRQFSIGRSMVSLIGILILWLVCMVKAYQGERFKLPLAGDVAEQIAGK